MSDALEPCPVCGPEFEDRVELEKSIPDAFGHWFVICRKCGLQISESSNPKIAALVWNVNAYNLKQEQEMKEINRKTVATGPATHGDQAVISRTETMEPGQESSVEISQNAKGEARVSVKVYHADAEQAATDAVALYRRTVASLASGGRV